MNRASIQIMLVIWCLALTATAQPFVAEPMVGDKNYYYQHTMATKFTEASRVGFFHTSSLHYMYVENEKDELMSQSYLTYQALKNVKVAGGVFYATNPGFTPSLALQYTFHLGLLRGIIAPRVDLKRNGSFEIMMAGEYIAPVSKQLEFYARAQFMSNMDRIDHNRSYQYFRAGLKRNRTVFGIAMNIDERGGELQTQRNYGIFIRYHFQ